ncbi:MAG: hypothetical protein C4532_01120 [Candidatus Abyssobacteria bacterium SURF_17]|jgi:hypothetical protein|uniref:Intracellular proteinase inhibitor BsuPI domain-containing protein n=1 Tax=Candidatus Abyssobacteria bacterium SURF_17 TaxID=2093361 RepID=A0A419F924_9BACT|nr:MAG: hypothetical protein C4532_01120 [Candidatus Abyssubacteria bacterium SURF_17]
MSEDPLFVQPGYWNGETWVEGDYHLVYGSPCIDRGKTVAVSSDVDGDTRPQGVGYDMGADEYSIPHADVDMILSPTATEILPGGTLDYTVLGINQTGSVLTIDFWSNVTLPDGSIYPPSGELIGPLSVALDPLENRSVYWTQPVPSEAEPGMYTYNAFVGAYPSIMNKYHFNFEITASP